MYKNDKKRKTINDNIMNMNYNLNIILKRKLKICSVEIGLTIIDIITIKKI